MKLSAHAIPYDEDREVQEGRVIYSWVDYDEKKVVALVVGFESPERFP